MLKLTRSQTTLAATAIKSFNSIPGPKAFPFVGSVPYYLPFIGKYDPMNVVTSGILKYKEYGPIVKERLISHDAILLFDPVDIETLFRHAGNNRRSHTILGHIRHNSEDHVNGGLLYEDGEAWAQLRTTSQQSLTAKTFEDSLPKFDEITCRFVSKIGGSDPVMSKVIEKDFLLGVLSHSSDAVAYMLFGLEWDSLSDILNEDALSTRIIHSSAFFNRNQAPMDHGFMLWKRIQGPMYAKMKKWSDVVDIVPEREVKRRLKDISLAEGPGILNSWIRGGRRDYKTMITVLSDFLLAGIDT